MLVLSRRPDEKILFPGINAAVQVLSCKQGLVRLGIEAPPDVTVLRGELAGDAAGPGEAGAGPGDRAPTRRELDRLCRQVRDRLQVSAVGLGTVYLLLDLGMVEDAKETLVTTRDDLQLLRLGLEGELDEAPRRQAAARKAPKALLVEDDRNQRELLAGLLRMGGIEVDTAGDGCDALDYLHSGGRPDVVLLDMGLPRCDGATTVRTIRRDPAYSGLRIFAVTGSSPDEFGLGSGPGGVDRWFQKPLDPTSLLDSLKRELEAPPCLA